MAFNWDPAQYQRFGSHRLRPALDLLAQVAHDEPRLVYDVGTGRGQIARLMAERWPGARVVGTDTSPEMLEAAAAEPGAVEWVEHDVRTWDPPQPPDIIFSNAVLHWVDDHDILLPRLAASLNPGGVLAVQMPLSWWEPSHRLMRETRDVFQLGSSALRQLPQAPPVAQPEDYHSWLRPHLADLNIWTTRYLQELTGPDPVFEWVSGTALRPILEDLSSADRESFESSLTTALRKAYPAARNGITLFPFPRLFIVGTRATED